MKNVWRMGALALSILLFGFLTLRFSPYPALRAFRERPVSTRVWDAHGNLLQVVAQENGVRREFVPLEQIPPAVQQFFLDAEDRHFYAHHGIDLGAIVRATAQNAREGRTVSGASTITMQLVRIMRPAQRRTLAIKVREAFDTLRLEARLSKHDILELYLNSVPFGFNTEGVASAARTFFATTVDALSAGADDELKREALVYSTFFFYVTGEGYCFISGFVPGVTGANGIVIGKRIQSDHALACG